MKIFDKNDKVNFVDENNVFIGYDMGQSCCEDADWFICPEESNNSDDVKSKDCDIESYIFDTEYFVEVENSKEFDGGGMVRFKLIAKDKKPLYLHLYNCHNGYYGHGFEAKIGEKKWHNGTL